MNSVFAHNSVSVGSYEIEVGWGIEPPIEGIRNDIVFKIIEHGEMEGTYTGITSAFKNLKAKIKHGGIDKELDINSDSRPGYYYSPIIPTKTGSYSVDIKGTLIDKDINLQIAMEDVESSAVLDFPFLTQSDSDVGSLKESVNYLQKQIRDIKSNNQNVTKTDTERTYGFVVLALSLSASAIITSILAMTRKY